MCVYILTTSACDVHSLYCAFNDFGSLLLYILLFVNRVLICNNYYYYFITGIYAITYVLLFIYLPIVILLFCSK